jgi:hypothetical protein
MNMLSGRFTRNLEALLTLYAPFAARMNCAEAAARTSCMHSSL